MKTFSTDILIIGGGSAGVAAAVSATLSNHTVTLIEQLDYLGGKATSAEVGTVCGLYKFKKSETTEYLVGGFAKEFADELSELSDTKPLHNIYGLHYLPYNINSYKNLCLQLMQKHNVTVYFKSKVTNVEVQQQKIKSVTIKTEKDEVNIVCKSIIDCSGNSCISQLANLALIKSKTYQAAAQVFTIQGIDPVLESNLNLIVIKEIQKAILNNTLDSTFNKISIVQGSLKNNMVSFKVGIPIAVTYEADNINTIRETAIKMIETFMLFAVNHISFLKNASIYRIAPEIGIRVGIRPVGNYILTEEDVLSCKKFDSAIANGSWPIEEWSPDKGVKMRYFNHDDFYQIPSDCLKSNSLSNLFFGGRNISATDGAIASARVIGICLQTGYAAGILASNNITKTSELMAIKAIQAKQIFV